MVVSPYTSLPNIFHTPGVANIENRYSSGGGSKSHTPGAATKRGDPDHVEGNTANTQGIGSPKWQEQIGGQKPDVSVSCLIEERGAQCLDDEEVDCANPCARTAEHV